MRVLVLFVGAAAGAAGAACSSAETTRPSSVEDADGGARPSKPARPPEDTPVTATGPERLSETGLYSDFAARVVASDVVHFAPAHPLWADGATKERYVTLPPGTKIDTSDMNAWRFPVGTKAWKEFRVDGRLVETRMLWKRLSSDGVESWWRVAYVWNADGSDAIAQPLGVKDALGTSHDVPNQQDCNSCHGNVADVIIWFSAFELSKAIMTFAERGWFSDPPARDFVVPGTGIVQEALGHLHGNCGFCHNDTGNLQFQSTMRLRLRTQDTAPEDTFVYTTAINAKMRHVMGTDIDKAVVPGEPEKSQLYMRMMATNIVRMPPTTELVDTAGTDVIRRWIETLPR